MLKHQLIGIPQFIDMVLHQLSTEFTKQYCLQLRKGRYAIFTTGGVKCFTNVAVVQNKFMQPTNQTSMFRHVHHLIEQNKRQRRRISAMAFAAAAAAAHDVGAAGAVAVVIAFLKHVVPIGKSLVLIGGSTPIGRDGT